MITYHLFYKLLQFKWKPKMKKLKINIWQQRKKLKIKKFKHYRITTPPHVYDGRVWHLSWAYWNLVIFIGGTNAK